MRIGMVVSGLGLAALLFGGCGNVVTPAGSGGNGGASEDASAATGNPSTTSTNATNATNATSTAQGSTTVGGDPVTCGGKIGLPCPFTDYCAYPLESHCGNADGVGTCLVRPSGCTDDVNPVCGCDGNTYTNECEANAAGFAVYSFGACTFDDQG